jgi:hypothetical protein
MGFEPTIPVFDEAKTVHALDREATVIGNELSGCIKVGEFLEYLSDYSFLEKECQLYVIYVDKLFS